MEATRFLADDAATATYGAELAAQLTPGALVTLSGDLGAGKTALARAIIRTLLADPELDVPSPSFALVQPYDGNGRMVLHADLYRLGDTAEIAELGLFDDPDAIVIIEWAERDPRLVAMATYVITLTLPAGGGRLATLSAANGIR
ncbi:MAG: tsaE [Devosia sp.]|nr:tsaE [Devosia sp.]